MSNVEHYDEDQAAVMIAALKRTRPADRINTLAVVAKVLIEGYLDNEPGEQEVTATRVLTPRRAIR